MIEILCNTRVFVTKPKQPWYMTTMRYEQEYLQKYWRTTQIPAIHAWMGRNYPDALVVISDALPTYGVWITISEQLPTPYGPYAAWDPAQTLVDATLNTFQKGTRADVCFERLYFCDNHGCVPSWE